MTEGAEKGAKWKTQVKGGKDGWRRLPMKGRKEGRDASDIWIRTVDTRHSRGVYDEVCI